MGIRSELWPDSNEKYLPASFKLTTSEKDTFLGILKGARLPDGFSSNISRCIDLRQRRMQGLKSHDCHVIMGHLLPIAIRNVSSPNVTSVITEFCQFFREICSKVVDVNELVNLQKQIVIILCHMEMLFPPSFFTVMIHLTIHLTEEIKLGGPVQFRWMYPVERILGKFKSYVINHAQPEGSICQQYMADECLTFCSMYLDGIETRFNQIGRGECNGASQYATLSLMEKQQAHRYILISCPFLDELRQKYKDELRRTHTRGRRRRYTLDVDREVHLRFDKWLREKVEKDETDGISEDIRLLAKGPSDKVLKFSSYCVNGYKYRTLERDSDLKTQNCGVYVSAETMSYASSRDNNPMAGNVPYYDTRDSRGYRRDGLGNNLVNFSRIIHSGESEEDEPFILASQARMVYYVEDPSEYGWNMDGIDSHVEETQDVNQNQIYTQGRERGKWVVNVIDSDSNVTEERLTAKDVWGMEKRRIILEFGPHDQPDGGSGGIFATWLGMLSTDLTKFPINYDDWRNVQQWRKDDAWDYIQTKFCFDSSNKNYKDFVMKSLSMKCKSLKTRLWEHLGRNNPEETLQLRPDFVPKEQWQDFVYMQFSERTKFLKTGKRPSRAEIYVSSRQKANGGYVNEEARDLSEKLTEKMVHTIEDGSSKDDEFSQVFGPEHPGRVCCVGLGPTPSSFFKNRISYETEVGIEREDDRIIR
ncbi:unnamed protein product [Microthlaspi erraticum]|uniref:DUF4218 domain-containing protein n=1 Tax=Microthlaspi erraticum TaxID=1685480 RepID=A0A6D2KWP9_9BRAS|nr:unnamed protein product [Microthlaspi erraticum]